MTRKVFFPDRVRHVDTVGENALVRSCMPLVGDPYAFALDELEAASGLPLAGKEIVVFSLIDCVGEDYMLGPEMAAFGLRAPPSSYWPPYLQAGWDPARGRPSILRTEGRSVPATFYWWPIEGFAQGEDPRVYLTSPGWDLSGLVDTMTSAMADRSGLPKVVVFHCTLGADRTGAAHTSYLVNKGIAFPEACSAADSSTSAGAPNDDYKRLRAAYAAPARARRPRPRRGRPGAPRRP
jgi:hypothetical protein